MGGGGGGGGGGDNKPRFHVLIPLSIRHTVCYNCLSLFLIVSLISDICFFPKAVGLGRPRYQETKM